MYGKSKVTGTHAGILIKYVLYLYDKATAIHITNALLPALLVTAY